MTTYDIYDRGVRARHRATIRRSIEIEQQIIDRARAREQIPSFFYLFVVHELYFIITDPFTHELADAKYSRLSGRTSMHQLGAAFPRLPAL